jgi:hypothetical protein
MQSRTIYPKKPNISTLKINLILNIYPKQTTSIQLMKHQDQQ